MYNIGDKVKVCVEDIYRIGIIDEILINHITKVVSYLVVLPFIDGYLEFYENELILYTHPHISNAFSRSCNETRQFDAENS